MSGQAAQAGDPENQLEDKDMQCHLCLGTAGGQYQEGLPPVRQTTHLKLATPCAGPSLMATPWRQCGCAGRGARYVGSDYKGNQYWEKPAGDSIQNRIVIYKNVQACRFAAHPWLLACASCARNRHDLERACRACCRRRAWLAASVAGRWTLTVSLQSGTTVSAPMLSR